MFDIGFSELLVIGVVALVVIMALHHGIGMGMGMEPASASRRLASW